MRDDFTQKTLDILAKGVGVRCTNPGCRMLTTGPRSDAGRIVCIGVGAHITAAAPGGKRYDGALTGEQRAAEENGIWLCQNCAKLIDNDEVRYTVAVLRSWKQKVHDAATAELEGKTTAARPEDAAELVLAVGGRTVVRSGKDASTGELPRPSRYGYDDAGCNRHDYALAVSVCNLGNERLRGYYVEVEFPARALEQPERHPAFVSSRSTRKMAFFRAVAPNATDLFPGDADALLTIPYYVDNEMFWNHRGAPEDRAYLQAVRVALYRSGLPPVVVERTFEDFSNY